MALMWLTFGVRVAVVVRVSQPASVPTKER